MKVFYVRVALACVCLALSCENTVRRPTTDILTFDTDTVAGTDTIPDTDMSGTSDDTAGTETGDFVISDEFITDEIVSDETTDEIASDDEIVIPDNDIHPSDLCADNGGTCVSDPGCPNGYTLSQQFVCAIGICCIPTDVSGLRVDVTGPQPVPGNLLAIPASIPQAGSGGTGTPEITSDIFGPLLALGLVDAADGCSAYKTNAGGFIVLVQRGNCTFSQKIKNAADAGAVAIIIYNNVPGPLGMAADGSIPTVGIEWAAGEALLGFTKEHPDITVAIRP